MGFLSQLKRPPWRTFVLLGAIFGLVGLAYLIWSPGKSVTDGRNDRGTNGLWLQHGWLGHDSWFNEHGRDRALFRDAAKVAQLAETLRPRGIRYVFPHLCPCRVDGRIASVDDAQVELFLDGFTGFDVIPWVGGVLDTDCSPESVAWRATFRDSVLKLLADHPRLAGVQVNIEPLPSGNPHFIALLKELHSAMPDGKLLSVAAYPPPTRWHKFPEVHWEEDYFREVTRHCDQIAVMMYDVSVRIPKLYESIMAKWTVEVLSWSEGADVLLGLPAYGDEDSGYHDPRAENLKHGLRGIHAGLEKLGERKHYRGTAIYSEWEMTEDEWETFRRMFRKEEQGAN